jgi:hypothetical protein
MKNEHMCWNFVMSSFARIYGVSRIKNDQRIHAFALEWCDENNYTCNIHLDDLRKVDSYFKQQYENWES